MKYFKDSADIGTSDFLIKTTLGVNVVSVLAVAPFALNNIIQGRYVLGAFTSMVSILCALNILYSYKGKYNLALNLFGLVPSITGAIAFALFELGVIGSYWPLLGLLCFCFVLPEKPAWIANAGFLAVILPVAWHVLEPAVAVRFSVVLVGASAYALVTIRIMTSQHEKLTLQAITDNLTGLKNRALLKFSLEQATSQYERTGAPMTMIMLDLDDFKSVNDTYGHDVGDDVLKTLGKVINDSLRKSDIAFRVGGEEFLVLLLNTDKTSGLYVASKLLAKIEMMPNKCAQPVTASMGVASLGGSKPQWQEWAKECDDNLYRAKSSGRNQVLG